MKKIILHRIIIALFFLFGLTKCLAFTITGPTTVCANQTYTYDVTGFPTNSTNHLVSWTASGDLLIVNYVNTSIDVYCQNFCPDPWNTLLTVKGISYYIPDSGKTFYITTGLPSISPVIETIGPILPSTQWNCTPYNYNTSQITYGINPVCGATNYHWSIPAGWTANTLLDGPNQTNITVTPDDCGAGTISVRACNTSGGCNVCATYSCNITRSNEAPVFNATCPTIICLHDTHTAVYCVDPVPNALFYNWTVSNGWLGGNISTYRNCITIDFNGIAQAGQISCWAVNACGGSPSITNLYVNTLDNPSFNVDITNHPGHCDYVLMANVYSTNITTYLWKYRKTGTSSWSTATTAINQCNSCILNASSSYDYDVTLTDVCNYAGNQTGTLGTPPPCHQLRLAQAGDTGHDQVETSDEASYIYANSLNSYSIIVFNSNEGETYNIKLFDIKGILISTVSEQQQAIIGKNKFDFTTDQIAPGIYFCLINSSTGRQEVLKFIK